MAHASVPWTAQHFDVPFAEVEEMMMEQVLNEIPGLSPKPHKSRLLRWRYSQVQKPYTDTPGHVVLSERPLVICAGDGFTHSNFDGCADSAYSVVEFLKTQFTSLNKSIL